MLYWILIPQFKHVLRRYILVQSSLYFEHRSLNRINPLTVQMIWAILVDFRTTVTFERNMSMNEYSGFHEDKTKYRTDPRSIW